jgi:hypothetical protein
MSDTKFITVRNYHDPILADIVVNALHAAGIITFPVPENNSGLPTDIQHFEIKVPASEVEEALEIIEEQESLEY